MKRSIASLITTALAAAVTAGGVPAASQAAAAPSAGPASTLRGFGANDDGAVGIGGGPLSVLTPAKVKVPKGITVTSVRASCDHAVALTSAGTVLAWGDNSEGQVGDGTTKTPRKVPVAVKVSKGDKITAVRAGCLHNLALTKTGFVLAWGHNNDGQLGTGGTRQFDSPVRVRLPENVRIKAISTGCADSFALTTTGQLYAWGANGNGQLGDGTRKQRHSPVLVKLPPGITVTQVAAGCAHTLALTKSGLFGWGNNKQGELGDDDTMSSDVPVSIPLLFRGTGPGTVVSLFAGCEYSMALFSKGGVLTWGSNSAGQLGDGVPGDSDKPVGVSLPDGVVVKAISAGCASGYALTSTGEVFAWGAGAEGELGNGGTSLSPVPVPVSLPAGQVGIALGSGPDALSAFVITHGAG